MCNRSIKISNWLYTREKKCVQVYVQVIHYVQKYFYMFLSRDLHPFLTVYNQFIVPTNTEFHHYPPMIMGHYALSLPTGNVVYSHY